MTQGETTPDARYAPPRAQVQDIEPEAGGTSLATRWQRLGAVLIDTVASFLVIWLLARFTPWNAWDQEPASLWEPAPQGALIGAIVFLVLHGWLLLQHGQTLGKRAIGIRITASDGAKASPGQLLVRYGVGFLTVIVPVVGQVYAMVDALLIFRASRRCLHDLIAGTIVVKA